MSSNFDNVVAMDCEMVGVGYRGRQKSALARISIVDVEGDILYDEYVRPEQRVTDYRTRYSGIRPSDLATGLPISVVRQEVADIIRGKILVGHSLEHDMRASGLGHPMWNIRDTTKYRPFLKFNNYRTPSLKFLAKTVLGINIQSGMHDSVEDAWTAMRLYLEVAQTWESMINNPNFDIHNYP